MRNKKMTFPEYLHEMPLNRIIYHKKAIAEPIPAIALFNKQTFFS